MEIKMGPIMGKAPATVGMLGVKEVNQSEMD